MQDQTRSGLVFTGAKITLYNCTELCVLKVFDLKLYVLILSLTFSLLYITKYKL